MPGKPWQRASKKALKGDHAQHIHAHCDCEYVIRFDSSTTVAGYDPDKYLEQYYAYGGDINAMRRAQYAANKDVINAQKRAAYALRQKNRGKKVYITDIAVEKVPKVSFGGISDEMAGTVQQAHKDMLRFAKEQNDSNEVAGLLDLNTGERLLFPSTLRLTLILTTGCEQSRTRACCFCITTQDKVTIPCRMSLSFYGMIQYTAYQS